MKQIQSCEEVLEHLLAYVDRELDARTSAAIDRHLKQCRGCFSRADFEKRLKARVAATGSTQTPEHVRSRVKALMDKF